MKLKLTLVALLLGAALPLAAVAPAVALPSQYPAGWVLQPGGLRVIALSVDTRGLCKGPSGTVYEVALGHTTGSYAAVEQVRLSDGTTARWWTYPATPGPDVIPRAAASDGAGGLYLAVETLTGAEDWVVLRYDKDGRLLWKRRYDSGNGQDTPYALAVDHKGAVIVTGTSEDAGGYDGAVVKWSATGRLRWKRSVSAAGLDLIDTVAVDAHDDVYAAGQTGESAGVGTAVLRSWTPGGRRRWSATVADPGASPAWRFLAVRGSAVTVAGQSTGGLSTNGFMAMRYTTGGKRAWVGPRTLEFANGAWVNGLAVDRQGAAVVVGTAWQAGAAAQDAGAVWKLRADGGTAWSRTFTAPVWPHDGEFDAVATDGAGRVYAAGGQYGTPGAGDLLLVRYSAGGAEQALWRATGPESGYCSFSNVLVLGDTRVIAAGQVAGSSGDAAIYRAQTTP